MLKRAFIAIILICTLTACSANQLHTNDTSELEAAHSFEPSTVEKVGASDGFSTVSFDSFETICEWSNAIVKATYLGCEEFDSRLNDYQFELETDFIGNVDESIIHVYEKNSSSFITGKTYYLFLSGLRSPLYPNILFSRVHPSFLLGENISDESKQYTFYEDYCLDVSDVENFDDYIETEVIQKGIYETEPDYLRQESVETAYENAGYVLMITVTDTTPENNYVSLCQYEFTKALKGENIEKF